MENDGGCFVTKIAPDGSAARSGGVEVGDQLAAINGQRSIKMKVEDIFASISKTPDPIVVQLAFVRYIGPFCPGGPLENPKHKVIKVEPQPKLRVITQARSTRKKKRRFWFKKGWR